LNSSTLKDRTKSLNRTGFVARSWLDVRQEPNDGWLADSGAFKHITRNRGYRIMMDNFNIRLMMNNRKELV
ncbi:hypothetical protein T09_622, partial [Trichinella sp. T9]